MWTALDRQKRAAVETDTRASENRQRGCVAIAGCFATTRIAAQCVAPDVELASHLRMTDVTRFQFTLPVAQRAQLEELAALAANKGFSRADLVRIGINWLIEHPDAILKFPQEAA